MRRFIVYGLTISLLAACSSKEIDIQTPVQEDVMFYASFEQPSESGTKVYANEDLLLRWTADDRVSIFNKLTYNQEYKFTGQTGANAGGFKKVDNDEFVTGNSISHVVSVYPYQESTEITESEVLTVTLPAEQSYAENTFGLGANTMVAVSEDNVLQYKNVCGYLRVSLYGEDVTVSSLTLEGKNGEKLAGKSMVTMSLDGVPTTEMADDATTEITLACDTPVALGVTSEHSVDFWFVIPPTLFGNGFELTVRDINGGIFKKTTTNKIEVKRNTLSKMSSLEVFIDSPIPSDDSIVFEDIVAKYACVEKFDTNGDGEVSFKEAASVTSLRGLFDNWNTVTSFEEIQFFTGVTSTEGVFTGLSKLESITIPGFITTLGVFSDCSSLKRVTLPSNLTSLPDRCFYYCSSLIEIDLPSGITSIPDYCFFGCSSLREVELPSSVKSIGSSAFAYSAIVSIDFPSSVYSINSNAFEGCSSLTSINVGEGVDVGMGAFNSCTSLESASLAKGVSLKSRVFSGCSALKSVILPEDLTVIPSYCFAYCSALFSITWPFSLREIGECAFYQCRFEGNNGSLQLPESITTIGSLAFGHIRHLILPSASIVSIMGDSFMQNYTYLYVPSNLVAMYKVRTNWSNYADRILPISDYPASYVSKVGGLIGEAIDLGLSVKWASWNIGASKPDDFGDYFAWGEIEPYYENGYAQSNSPLWKSGKDGGYCWDSYSWCNGSRKSLTMYNTKSSYGVVDNKTTLDLSDDAAHIQWGKGWRMPSLAEWAELMEFCTITQTWENGVIGVRITSEKDGFTDKSIFLPAAGYRSDNYFEYSGDYYNFQSYYWSSTLGDAKYDDSNGPHEAYIFLKSSTRMGMWGSERCNGFPIRPVCE